MEGTFYELAYHDYTQPRNLCGCERSVKTGEKKGVEERGEGKPGGFDPQES